MLINDADNQIARHHQMQCVLNHTAADFRRRSLDRRRRMKVVWATQLMRSYEQIVEGGQPPNVIGPRKCGAENRDCADAGLKWTIESQRKLVAHYFVHLRRSSLAS